MALFNTTPSYEDDFNLDYPSVTEGLSEIMIECMEDSYKLTAGIYVADALLEQHLAKGTSEDEISAMLESTKVGFKEKVKKFFKTIWQKIVWFFKNVKARIKALFNKRYREQFKRAKARAKARKAAGKPSDVEEPVTSAEVEAPLDATEKAMGAMEKELNSITSDIESGKEVSAEEAKERLAKAVDPAATDVSTAKTEFNKKARVGVASAAKQTGSANYASAAPLAKDAEAAINAHEKNAEKAMANALKITDITEKGIEQAKNKLESFINSTEDPKIVQSAQTLLTAYVNLATALQTQATNAAQDVANKSAKRAKASEIVAANQQAAADKIANENEPKTESYITQLYEGYDDTPDLDDLDDDLDDTDESCGKKSLKEGATLLDQALGML